MHADAGTCEHAPTPPKPATTTKELNTKTRAHICTDPSPRCPGVPAARRLGVQTLPSPPPRRTPEGPLPAGLPLPESTHTHTCTHICPHARTHTHICTHTHTHAQYIHTHTRTHIYMHTHTHKTRTQNNDLWELCRHSIFTKNTNPVHLSLCHLMLSAGNSVLD